MRSHFILFFALLFNGVWSNAQDQYYVIFHCYEESLEDGSPGHLFVEFARKQNGGAAVSEGKFGFYPSEDYDKEQFKKGESVEGEIVNESQTKIDYSFAVEVTKKQYTEAVKVKTEWQSLSTMPYQGIVNDCISFSFEVAEAAGLTIDGRPLNPFPKAAFECIKSENPQPVDLFDILGL